MSFSDTTDPYARLSHNQPSPARSSSMKRGSSLTGGGDLDSASTAGTVTSAGLRRVSFSSSPGDPVFHPTRLATPLTIGSILSVSPDKLLLHRPSPHSFTQRPGNSAPSSWSPSPGLIGSRPSSAMHSAGGVNSHDKSMLPGHGKTQTLSQRLATTQAAYNAAGFSQTVDSLIRSGVRPGSSRVQGAMDKMRSGSESPSRGGPGGSTPRKSGQRPGGYCCYLCGAMYGSASLHIHVEACQKKWLAAEATKAPRDRRSLPPPPQEMSGGIGLPASVQAQDEFNASMSQYFDKVSLMPCGICGRTFRPDAMTHHVKVCTPDKPGGPLGPGRNMPKPGTAPVGSSRTSSTGDRSGVPSGAATGASQPGAGSSGPTGTGSRGGGSGGPNMASKPCGFTCYLCGQQYGSKSLIIHISSCQKMWLQVEAAKPAKERRALPPPPAQVLTGQLPTEGAAVDEFNKAMYNHWDKVSLVSCKICGRSFRQEAFDHHAKVCTPDRPGGPLGMPKNAPSPATTSRPGTASTLNSPKPGTPSKSMGSPGGRIQSGTTNTGNYDSRPRAFMCFLCGQQYGSSSLQIHVPQCYEKWLKVESVKSPKERRQPPPPPAELDNPLPVHPDDVDSFNQRMSDIYNGASLTPCQHCGRTMRPEALVHHQKMCTPEHPMTRTQSSVKSSPSSLKPPSSTSGGSRGANPNSEDGSGESSNLEQCRFCSRKMLPEVLSRHYSLCTAEKPMKGLPERKPSNAPPPQIVQPPSSIGSGTPHPTQPVQSKMTPQPPSTAAGGRGPAGAGSGGNGGAPGRPGGPPPRRASQASYTQPEQQQYGAAEDGRSSGGDVGRQAAARPAGGGSEPDDGSIRCGSCGRTFNPEAYEHHSRICARVFGGKRKVFNSKAARVEGTEAAAYNTRPTTKGAASKSSGHAGEGISSKSEGGSLPTWKTQSNALRDAMAAQRQVAAAIARGESVKNIPVVYSGPDPSFIQCPHCSRYFAPKAADRHIPACASTISKPKFLKAGTGGSGQGAPDQKALPIHARRR